MTNERSERVTRRTVLGATGALAIGGTALGASADPTAGDGIVLEQDGDCIPLTPISGRQSAEALYDYDIHDTDYSSAGTRDLQRGDTSILFLYEDPAGNYYLVIVHDRYDTDDSGSQYDGGSATFEFSGLAGGSWVVRDDDYDSSSSYDRWAVSQEPQVVDWTWGDARTDGGVYGPLGDDFAVTIDPAFNEAAGLWEEYYSGEITDWEVLSGDRSNPDRTSLALDQPITIRVGDCGPSRPPAPGQLDVRIPQGRVNPRSQGMLAVDLHSTQSYPVTDLDVGSVQTTDGVSPSQIELRPDDRDVVRLLFRVPALDLSSGSTATIRIRAETTDGRPGTGSATVRLVPQPDNDDDDEEGEEEEDDEDEEDEEDEEEDEEEEEEDEADDDDENDGERGPPGGSPGGPGGR